KCGSWHVGCSTLGGTRQRQPKTVDRQAMNERGRRAMGGHDNLIRNERGMALVVALLVLLTLSALGSSVLMTITSDIKGSGHGLRETKSLNFAEAGVTEAIARIRSGEISIAPNPKMVTQIFLASSGQLPALGPDSLALATAQPGSSWLTYSTRDRSPDALT